MTTPSENQSKKINRVSRIVTFLAAWGALMAALATLAGITFTIAFTLATLRGSEPAWAQSIMVNFGFAELGLSLLSSKQILVLLPALSLASLLITLCLYFLFRLFKTFRQAGVFSAQATKNARTLAYTFTLSYLFLLLFDLFCPFLIGSEAMKAIATNAYFQEAILLGAAWIGVWILEYGQALLTENEMTI